MNSDRMLRGAVLTRAASGCVAALFLQGCALQPAYRAPALEAPASWHNAAAASAPTAAIDREGWWSLLGDPGIDRLVEVGLRDNPTLSEAAARVDQARAVVRIEDARKQPSVGAEGKVTQTWDRQEAGRGTTGQIAATAGTTLSWELDLWGRVRESSIAAQNRLAARTADAEAARLLVIGEIAGTAIALRACNLTRDIRDRDISARQTELLIDRARLQLGSIAPVTVAAAESNLASAQTDRITQDESCRRLVDALAALSGTEPTAVEEFLSPAVISPSFDQQLPRPPAFVPALPATVLLRHPAVVAAEREAAARWSEIAIARAERMPRIDLGAVLTGQWISALGSSSSFVSSSAGAGLTAPVLDNGAGSSNVAAAEAVYREAGARLAGTIRNAVRDIEDGLAAQQSANGRIETAHDALQAAQFALKANEARWQAGAIAAFEFEETRRQLRRAQESAIAAAADRARAWVVLVMRTGTAWDNPLPFAGEANPGGGLAFDGAARDD